MTVSYYTINGQIIAQAGATRTHFLTDALGSVTATVSDAGVVQNTYRFKPFGTLLAKTVGAPDPKYLWVGSAGYRSHLSSLGQVTQYVRARHYLSQCASWSTVDGLWPPEGAYEYGRSNPIMNKDFSGLASSCGSTVTQACNPVTTRSQCCIPKVQCLTGAFLTSQANFRMTLPRNPPGHAIYGELKVAGVFSVDYVPAFPGASCPAPSLVSTSVIVAATSGQVAYQFWGGWCTPFKGPTPPTKDVTPPMMLWTTCSEPDPEGMSIGNEGFKFRIGATTQTYSVKCDGGKVGRNRMLVHPDGPPVGTLGCVGIQSEAGSLSVRSCLHWLNLYGCSEIPLFVEYDHV